MPPNDIVFDEIFSNGIMRQLHSVVRDLEEAGDNLDDNTRYGIIAIDDWLYIFHQAVESI